jgi:hypothetical protein
MPLLRYFLFVGGFLLCCMFAADAYLPKQLVREQKEFNKTIIRVERSSQETASTSPDLFLAIPQMQTTSPAPLPSQTRQAFAAIPVPSKHKTRRMDRNIANREVSADLPAQPYKRDGFPTW